MASATHTRGVDTTKLDALTAGLKEIGLNYTDGDGFGWEIRRLKEYRDGLFDRCHVQPEDRVRLVRDPAIEPSSGWYPNRDSFVEGALATVVYIDFYRERFQAAIMFDVEITRFSDGARHVQDEATRHWFVTPARWWAVAR